MILSALSYALAITATVPVVCRVEDAELLCNAPGGYELLAVAQDGAARLLEHSDGPARKSLTYALAEGERFVIVAR